MTYVVSSIQFAMIWFTVFITTLLLNLDSRQSTRMTIDIIALSGEQAKRLQYMEGVYIHAVDRFDFVLEHNRKRSYDDVVKL